MNETVDLHKPEEIALLRHFLLTALNNIIGHADVVRRRAREQGARSDGELMREAAAAGRESVEILQHLLPVKSHISESALPMLRSYLSPRVERVEKVLASFEAKTADACAAELSKMRMALLDLAGFVRGSGPMPAPAANPRARVFEMPPSQQRFEISPAPTVCEVPVGDGEFRAAGRVFIADDDEGVRATVASLLESARLTPVAGGRADLEQLRIESFDLMLVDLDLFDEVRAIPGAAGIPAIVLAGSDRSEGAVQALESGAGDFITKPVDSTILHARVNGILRRRQAESAAAAIAKDVHGLVDAIVANTSLLLAGLPASDLNGQVLAHIAAAGERAAELTRQLISSIGRQNGR